MSSTPLDPVAAPGDADLDRTAPITPGPAPVSVWRDLGNLAIKVGVILAVFALIFTVTHGIARSGDADMSPAVNDGDLVMFYRLDTSYQMGDLLVVTYDGETHIRRVVAVQGDTVDIDEDGLIVNGAHQQELDIHQPTTRFEGGIALPVTLGPGEVFVLGDARADATDSRMYGPVAISDTSGKVIALIKWRDL
ncbi:MAG: signal peptidase I [Propionibacteriaceae bacterium]|nr:signal peptidase I [Propionibacteriaceae bacterium]